MRKSKSMLTIIILLITSVMTIACGKQPEPDWVSDFVVYEGNLYEVTQQKVEQVENKIGEIDKLIKDSAIHSGNISNTFPEGTVLYSIVNVEIQEAIAVEASEGEYLQANFNGQYGK